MMNRLAGVELAPAGSLSVATTDARHLLPPRSMVGQLTLDQHIGVRIPGGQPIKHFPTLLRTFPNFPELM